MESMRPFRLHSSLLIRRTDEKQVQAVRYDLFLVTWATSEVQCQVALPKPRAGGSLIRNHVDTAR